VIYRLRKAEAALAGKPFSEAEFEAAAEIAREEITPISDVRGDGEYRFQLAENILRKFYFDVGGAEVYERLTDSGRSGPKLRSTAARGRFDVIPQTSNGNGGTS
jgi:xanthine dehydrogenase iron-sulfur cluster and FAD-binding subunit A